MTALSQFLILIIKLWFLFLFVWPVSFLLNLLSDPKAAHLSIFGVNATLTVYSIMALSQSETGFADKALAIPLFPSVAMSATLIAYYIGAVDSGVFVILCAIFGIILTQGLVLLSVLMGNSNKIVVQQMATTIGILSPIVMSLVWIFTGSGIAFHYGCLFSVIASVCNVLFNKSSLSVGFPQLPGEKLQAQAKPMEIRRSRTRN